MVDDFGGAPSGWASGRAPPATRWASAPRRQRGGRRPRHAAKEAVGERAVAAKEATAEAIAAVKPKLRGVSHEWAFFVSLCFGAALILAREDAEGDPGGGDLRGQPLGPVRHQRPLPPGQLDAAGRAQWMRRLDHSMIFFLIAGTYTPFALLVLDGALASAILVVVWAGAIAGAIVETIWIDHPKWVSVADLHVARLGRRRRLPGAWSSLGVRRRARWSSPAASYTPPAPSSTRPSGPTPTRRSSATTRSSTFRHRRRGRPLLGGRLLRPAAGLTKPPLERCAVPFGPNNDQKEQRSEPAPRAAPQRIGRVRIRLCPGV